MERTIGPITFIVERSEVEAKDTSRTLAFLNSFLESSERARVNFQNIDLAFSGYDEDPRELFEIENVRDFVHNLDLEFPYWLYFMALAYEGLYAIAMCFLLPYLTDKARAEIHPKQLVELFDKRWVPALNALGAKTEIADTEIDLVTSRCVNYFLKGREKPPMVN